jgi:hypothetical protein
VSVGQTPDQGPVIVGFGGALTPQTFHPDVTDAAKAAVITLAEGQEATGIDIAVGRPLKAFSATGRIVDAETGKPAENVRYGHGAFRPGEPAMGGYGYSSNRTNSRGEFRLEGLLPGRYAAMAVPDADSDFYSEATPFEISSSDVTGVEVRIRRGGSISGAVVFDGPDDPAIAPRLAQVMLMASVFSTEMRAPSEIRAPRMTPGRIAPDGSFALRGLQPGKTRIQLGGSPVARQFTILRIDRAGVDISEGCELAPGEQITGVKIVVTIGTGAIRGSIKVQGNAAPPQSTYFVSVRRLDSTSPPQPGDRTDLRGRFLIEGLTAGQYEVSVLSPEARGRFWKQVVTVAAGSTTEVDVVIDPTSNNEEKKQ